MTSNPPITPGQETRYELLWFVPLAAWTAFELWLAGGTRFVTTYTTLAFGMAGVMGGCAIALLLFRWMRSGESRPIHRLGKWLRMRWQRVIFVVLGVQLSGLGFAAFTRIKLQLPSVVPFYADRALADFDYWLLGQDAWIAFDSVLGWAKPFIFAVYWLWLPVQMIAYPAVLLCPPSRLKTQGLLANALMWGFLGILCAFAFSSVGPIFYDRLLGGSRFAGLDVWKFGEVADYLWWSYVRAEQGVGVGISAMPSMHVASATWLALVLRAYVPRMALVGWIYLGLIYVGSVMTGWHYASDGVIGAIGAGGCWFGVGWLLNRRNRSFGLVRSAVPATT